MKTTKPSTQGTKRRKSALFDYYCDQGLKQQPISLQGLEKLAEEVVEWAFNDESARKLRPFFNEKGITSRDIKRWSKRSKKFKHAYSMAKAAIGDRREDGGLTNKLNASIVIKGLSKYDDEWKALETWRSEMKTKEKENEKEPTIFNVTMPSFSRKEDEKVKGDN